MASRFSKPGEQFEGLATTNGSWSGEVRFYPERLEKPFRWRAPRRIFVNSMSDLFHSGVTNEQIAAVFGVIASTPRHQYFILTKRPERMVEWFRVERTPAQWMEWFLLYLRHNGINSSHFSFNVNLFSENPQWPLPNLWLGVSVEDQPTADERIPLLFRVPATKRFVSYEPGIDWVRFKNQWLGICPECDGTLEVCRHSKIACCPDCSHLCSRLDLVICGAETGPRKRPLDLDWARSVRDQCSASGVPFWFKKDSDGNETLDEVEHHPGFWK
jgi:protein gp37